MIELGTDRIQVAVDPHAGGRLARLVVDGVDVLVPADADGGRGPLEWGCYPMVPWAGRLAGGLLRFDGAEHRFPLTMAPHAIHGTTWSRPWQDAGHDDTSAALRIDLGPPWPFGGHAVHRVSVDGARVILRLEIHAGDFAMPVACGWHPWFRRELGRGGKARLAFAPDAMWERGEDGIPTGRLVPPPTGPWDDCFTGLHSPPVVSWPDAAATGGSVALTLESPCQHWVVYDEPVSAICVEPQTSPPNGLNTGPIVLGPSEVTGTTMIITPALVPAGG